MEELEFAFNLRTFDRVSPSRKSGRRRFIYVANVQKEPCREAGAVQEKCRAMMCPCGRLDGPYLESDGKQRTAGAGPNSRMVQVCSSDRTDGHHGACSQRGKITVP